MTYEYQTYATTKGRRRSVEIEAATPEDMAQAINRAEGRGLKRTTGRVIGVFPSDFSDLVADIKLEIAPGHNVFITRYG